MRMIVELNGWFNDTPAHTQKYPNTHAHTHTHTHQNIGALYIGLTSKVIRHSMYHPPITF